MSYVSLQVRQYLRTAVVPVHLVGSLLLFAVTGTAAAQGTFDARWIQAPEETGSTAWFRHAVRVEEPSTGAVRVVASSPVTLWVNGQKVGEAKAGTLHRFNLSGLVGRGMNVVGLRLEAGGTPHGVFVDGEVRGQSGNAVPFDSSIAWKVTTNQPASDAWLKAEFDLSGWKTVRDLGPHPQSPWKDIALQEGALDRFSTAPGFELTQIAAPELTGSLVAITWGNRGRLLASRERGPIVALADDNGDGTFDRTIEVSPHVTNCQGLCVVHDDLYAVGDGPKGTGLYRLPDANHDDIADRVELIHQYEGGMAEHGPHAVVFGPDGNLYNNMGNHAWVQATPEPGTPVRDSYEGHLLEPKFEDARGHARGIKVPGGTIWRFSPDGSRWWCETAGFRNEYDIAFSQRGDLFSFDSDMEWDVGMPWYRPVRITHCVPGAEFGWRSGCGKWPAEYFDSLPGTVDIGRGSPTGVVFYEHTQFPDKYHGALLACDWSMGRILAVQLSPSGGSFTGEYENLVTGNPLNVADIEVAPDGSVIFATGGRRTEGGVYRLSWREGDHEPARASTVGELLDLPQPAAAWHRELARRVQQAPATKATWQAELETAVRGDSAERSLRGLSLLAQHGPVPSVELLTSAANHAAPTVRAFAIWLLGTRHAGQEAASQVIVAKLTDSSPLVQRRACEALLHSSTDPGSRALVPLLASQDRHVRFAARLALERCADLPGAAASLLKHEQVDVVLLTLLALYRTQGADFDAAAALEVTNNLLAGDRGELSERQTMDALRATSLALQAGGRPPVAGNLAGRLLKLFPSGNPAIDAEAARLLAKLQHRDAVGKLLKALGETENRSRQIDYALSLHYLQTGWNFPYRQQYLNWYDSTRSWEGGNSFGPYLANIVGATIDRYPTADRQRLLDDWKQRPFATGLLISRSDPGSVTDFEQTLMASLDQSADADSRAQNEQLVFTAIEALGRNASPAAQGILRRLYDQFPDRREHLARVLAGYPTAENWPYLLRSLSFGDPTTTQMCVRGMRLTARKEKTPAAVRAVILAALRLGPKGGFNALNLLRELTGSEPEDTENFAAAIAHYQDWYTSKYPKLPPAKLPKVDPSRSKYTVAQLLQFLEQDPRSRTGNVERGRELFAKAKCIKCHRFLDKGETIGPDLTSVRRRFQRKEIVESLVTPSAVISDQYRMVTVVTTDGLVHNGMPVPSASGADKLVLLLQDATKLEILQDRIDEQVPSTISVMPQGTLNDLTLEQLADLFAFLETSRSNPLTPRNAARAAGGQAGGADGSSGDR